MDRRLQLSRATDLTAEDREEIRALSLAVYPPDEWADWPGQFIEWAQPEWCVRIWGDDGTLASYSGIFLRDADVDGTSMRIGGVGSVQTHPAARGRGYARAGIEKAFELFHAEPDVAFALLVCEPHLLPYYSSLGWSEFHGRMLVLQGGEEEEFTFNRVMTRAVRSDGPSTGTIHLRGAPW